MDNLQFIQRLYNGKNCYSDSMSDEQIELLHIVSGVESIVTRMISENRIVFLTGNPGDGKTFIIRRQKKLLEDIYTVMDLNSVNLDSNEGDELIEKLYQCYKGGRAAIIAANEFPFHRLTVKMSKCHLDMYEELIAIRNNILYVDYPRLELRRICIIDLNERNLLDKERNIVDNILVKFTNMLEPYKSTNITLGHNIVALSDENVKMQICKIFTNISMMGRHFVIRDILGTISYILVSCIDTDNEGTGYYYDALFDGNNEIMSYVTQFDPILLSCASIDEKIWNGEMREGWYFGQPSKWPYQITKDEGSIEEATTLFRSIKRKFFFENAYAKELINLQPLDFDECVDVLINIKQESRRIKRMLINSMNKIFLSTDAERDKLRVWTTHNYDLSRTVTAAVSTRYVDVDDLCLDYPEPVEWLKKMEYVPSKLILYYRGRPEIRLDIDTNFLQRLIMIKNGYPASLLSEQYEQSISHFLKTMEREGACKDYAGGEILVCNRKTGTYTKLYVEDSKYSLGSEADY